MKKNYYYFFISIFIIVFDQITKIVVRDYFQKHPEIDVIPVIGSLCQIVHVQNTGAAFSLSLGSPLINRIVFIFVSVIAVGMLIYFIIKGLSKIELVTFSLILGGAVGNLSDRIFLGSVTDFIDCDFPDIIMYRWPVFNVADSSIVVAITIYLVYSIFFEKKLKEKKNFKTNNINEI